MESWLGEYILNVPKEQIKVAALRGRIKVENVQLDGDLIGSEIMGAVGLSGFGILSCSAKSMQMVVPWTNLEKEPTRFQLTGRSFCSSYISVHVKRKKVTHSSI